MTIPIYEPTHCGIRVGPYKGRIVRSAEHCRSAAIHYDGDLGHSTFAVSLLFNPETTYDRMRIRSNPEAIAILKKHYPELCI